MVSTTKNTPLLRYNVQVYISCNNRADTGFSPIRISNCVEINNKCVYLAVITCVQDNYIHRVVTRVKTPQDEAPDKIAHL
jgi:hypothetical protein